MGFISALFAVVAFVSGLISIYEFIKSRRQPGAVFGLAAAGMLVAALVIANLPPQSVVNGTETNSIQNSGYPQQGQGVALSQTPASLPKPGDLLYRWTPDKIPNGSPDWKVESHMLVNDGTHGNYEPNGPTLELYNADVNNILNYKIVAQIQVVRQMSGDIPPQFWIIVRNKNLSGYFTGVDFKEGSAMHIVSYENGSNFQDLVSPRQFDPQGSWHTYTVVVKGGTLSLSVDDSPPLLATDYRFTDQGGTIGLRSVLTVLNIRSFEVFAV